MKVHKSHSKVGGTFLLLTELNICSLAKVFENSAHFNGCCDKLDGLIVWSCEGFARELTADSFGLDR